jgi:hypothetical protein
MVEDGVVRLGREAAKVGQNIIDRLAALDREQALENDSSAAFGEMSCLA